MKKDRIAVYGVGFLGVGEYRSEKNGKSDRAYSKWSGMLERCYSDRYHKLKPTYKDCSVHLDWHNFQVFAKWFKENYVEGFELDKDILFKGNKVYSAETCCFVPREINTIMRPIRKKINGLPNGVRKRGEKFIVSVQLCNIQKYMGSYLTIEKAFCVYKKEKEDGVKIVANKYKDKITPECYNSLINWTIDIND